MTSARIGFLIRNVLDHIPYYAICIWEFIYLWLVIGKRHHKYNIFWKLPQLMSKYKSSLPLFFNHQNYCGLLEDLPTEEPFAYNSEFNIHANPWGIKKLSTKNKSWQFHTEIGKTLWRVIAPIGNWGVLGYPSVVKQGVIGALHNLPRINIGYTVLLWLAAKKKYNLTFDFWLLSNGTEWQWSDVKQEIMIWEDRNIALPFGEYKGDFHYNNDIYHIYHGYKDRSKENLGVNGWYITSFVRSKTPKTVRKTNTIKLNKFVDALFDKNLIVDTDLYLHNIELGTEIYNTTLMCQVDAIYVQK